MFVRFVLAAAFAASVIPAAACSVASGYRVPTTLELAQEADVIIIAYPSSTGRSGSPTIRFVGGQFLKSMCQSLCEGLTASVDLPGVIASGARLATPSDPRELARANPEAYSGACSRFTFAQDVPVLLFLTRERDGYRAISYPFARTMEDAPGINGLWARAVREYVAIAALPKPVQRARLEARRDILSTKSDADSRAIAADMDRELNAPRKPLREPLPPAP